MGTIALVIFPSVTTDALGEQLLILGSMRTALFLLADRP
jgi:hypothetical protein